MTLRALALLLSLILCCGHALSRDAASRERELAVAEQAVEQGVYLFALDPLLRLAEDAAFPSRPRAVILLARTRLGLGEYDSAAAVLLRFQERFPDGARHFMEAVYWSAVTDLRRASLALSGSAERRNYLKSAVEGFRQVLDESSDPNLLGRARFNLGVSHIIAEDYRSALEALTQARQLGVHLEDRLELDILLARAHLGLRDFGSALTGYAGHIEANPESPFLAEAHFGLGEAHYFMEEWPRSADNYRFALEHAARRGDGVLAGRARYALAWALAKHGERPSAKRIQALVSALEHFDQIVSDGRSAPEERETASYQAARMLHLMGRHGEAAERLLPLTDVARYPDRAAQALHVLGLSRKALGQFEAAIDSFERLLEMGERVPSELARRARFALAETLVESGEPEAARAVLQPMTGQDQPVSIRASALQKSADIVRTAASSAEAFADAFERYRSIAGDASIMVELSADEIAYWIGRSAHDCAALSSGQARQTWLERAMDAYSSVRRGGARNVWLEKALLGTASLHIDRGRLEESVRVCRELIALPGLSAENEIAGRIKLARIEHELGRYRQAREALSPIIERADLSPGRHEAAYQTARAHLAEGNAADALDGFRRISDDRLADALRGAADSLLALGHVEEAAAEYVRLMAEHPNYVNMDEVRMAAGDSYRRLGRSEDASAIYHELYELGSSPRLRALARLHEARIALGAGRVEPSLAMLDDAASLPVDDALRAEIAFASGEALAAAGRHAEAAQRFAAAAAAGDLPMRLEAVFARARAVLAASRDAAALRRAARDFTWVAHYAGSGSQRRAARTSAAEALVSLSELERSQGDVRTALAELREARALLRGSTSDEDSILLMRIEQLLRALAE